MASKKKAKAGARKTKAGARKTKPKAKAKAGARKAKAGASKKKAAAAKKKPAAAKKKPATRKAKPRKPALTVVKTTPPATDMPSSVVIVDEVIEESLLDVSTVLRIKDGIARSQRDVDEDELKQFPDPSLVVEAQASITRDDDTDPSISQLPDLFAAEARRQKERLGDRPADAGQKPRDSSLFGSLGARDDEPDSDED